jgi:ubiquinone/menaquinone biosynthesis C-methylase UbiE
VKELQSIRNAHQRYTIQATWTESIRQKLLADFEPVPGSPILEVGSGTGVILAELTDRFNQRTYGIDLDVSVSSFARSRHPASTYLTGDGAELPFASQSFGIVLCHFLLMWVDDPAKLLDEMVRVTKPGGAVLALAEPDYGGRIDYPEPLADLGQLQRESLREQGADPLLGRKLRALFHQTSLVDIQAGVLGGEWKGPIAEDSFHSEWETLEKDLENLLSNEALSSLRALDMKATQKGARVLYVPTFYAAGRVPENSGSIY